MAENTMNGDTKVILERIDNLGKILAEQKDRQGLYHAESQRQFEEITKQTAELKLQTALLQNNHNAIYRQVDQTEQKVDKNDLWTKIIGALTTFMVALGTGIVIYLTSVMQRLAEVFNHINP